MARTSGKNSWALFLMILAGIVLGGFIGYLAKDISVISWLNFGQEFGFESPVKLNLGVIDITFGLNIKITIASILGIVASIIVYRNI